MTAVLVPWFGIDPYRAAGVRHVIALYEQALGSWPLFSGGGSSIADARNRLAEASGHVAAEVLVFNDADSLVPPEQIRAAVQLAADDPGLVHAFDNYQRLTQQSTSRLNHWSEAFAMPVEPGQEIFGSCSAGCIAIRRSCFDQVGGFDVDFGSACEDLDFFNRCAALWQPRRVAGDLVHLWHPRPQVEPQDTPQAALYASRWPA